MQFAGWFLVYNSLPFGFKASAYIYHSTGLVPISYCRSVGVPSMLYIDDMLVCEFKSDQENETGNVERSWRSLYILCPVLLDWIIILPDQKRQSFKVLRESILEKDETEIQYLQRFAGKCVSFYLAIPSARLFSRG